MQFPFYTVYGQKYPLMDNFFQAETRNVRICTGIYTERLGRVKPPREKELALLKENKSHL